jgi:hypothetical protein
LQCADSAGNTNAAPSAQTSAAEVEIKKSGEQCVILTQGGLFGGYALMLSRGSRYFTTTS